MNAKDARREDIERGGTGIIRYAKPNTEKQANLEFYFSMERLCWVYQHSGQEVFITTNSSANYEPVTPDPKEKKEEEKQSAWRCCCADQPIYHKYYFVRSKHSYQFKSYIRYSNGAWINNDQLNTRLWKSEHIGYEWLDESRVEK